MKCITARYFVTCLSCPDTFDLANEMQTFQDSDNSGMGGNMQMMQAMMMNGGVNAEQLASGLKFEFSRMQNDLWDAVRQTSFTIHRFFMAAIFQELNDDTDTRTVFFRTMFEKMHLEL